MKASAIANANIALTKYWGKRDTKLMLPQNGSVSMTVDGFNTKTTVEFSPNMEKDVFIINGNEVSEGNSPLERSERLGDEMARTLKTLQDHFGN